MQKIIDLRKCLYINLPEKMRYWQSSCKEYYVIYYIFDFGKKREKIDNKTNILSHYVDSKLPV